MIAYSDDKKPIYEVDERNVRVHWNYKQITGAYENDERIFWKYNELIFPLSINREEMISALMNNGLSEDDATELSDGYFQDQP